MKKSFLLLMLACAAFTTACSSDDDNNNDTVDNASRDIKYEVTGNYTGELTVAFIAQTGLPATRTLDEGLPWTFTFTADTGSSSAGFGVTGSGGVEGQTIEATIYQGGVEKGSVTATATSEGLISATPPAVTFD